MHHQSALAPFFHQHRGVEHRHPGLRRRRLDGGDRLAALGDRLAVAPRHVDVDQHANRAAQDGGDFAQVRRHLRLALAGHAQVADQPDFLVRDRAAKRPHRLDGRSEQRLAGGRLQLDGGAPRRDGGARGGRKAALQLVDAEDERARPVDFVGADLDQRGFGLRQHLARMGGPPEIALENDIVLEAGRHVDLATQHLEELEDFGRGMEVIRVAQLHLRVEIVHLAYCRERLQRIVQTTGADRKQTH